MKFDEGSEQKQRTRVRTLESPKKPNDPEGFELPFQMEYFKRVMRENIKHRGRRITIQ